MKKTTVLLGSVCCVALNSVSFADEISAIDPQGLSFGSILSTMNVGGGSSTAQWQVAPTYSELFGLGVRATVGTYVTEDFAVGMIIDVSEYREEYLANAGVRLNDDMRVIGSIGILKEQEEFIAGNGREDVQQLEYGLSLKGNYNAGILRGFEVNAYHTNASSDTDSVETGDLTGLQIVTALKPADSADIRIGAGYERAEWDGGDVDEGLTLQARGSLKVSDTLSLNYEAKSAETENTYGVGLTFDTSTPEVRNSALSISFNEIEGKHGISDDTRVAINWTIGFGAGGANAASADTTVSSMGSMAHADLLADVMTRPAFLPKRVLARAVEECPFAVVNIANRTQADNVYDYRSDPYSFGGSSYNHHVAIYIYGPSDLFTGTGILLNDAQPNQTIANDNSGGEPAAGYTAYGYVFGLDDPLTQSDTVTLTIPSYPVCNFTLTTDAPT
jgi:hypothetical protein